MDQTELPMNLRDDNLNEETKIFISSLPSEKDSLGKLCNYQSCWYYYNTLQGVINFQRGFKPEEADIVLASFPKSGTTWLKALTIALLDRSKNPSSADLHPLQSDNPHGLVPFLEDLYLKNSKPDLTKFSSSSSSSSSSSTQRLFSTHMPFHSLQVLFKEYSPCKIVYVCRNVKDVLVSHLFFRRANINKVEGERNLLVSLFESYCRGVNYYGPFWEHVLSYWRGSLEDPKHVLFMRYEEMKAEPRVQIKRLAEFLECPFTKEEEESGGVDKILELCAMSNLRGYEINKTGKTWNNVNHYSYFRKGEVGDWKNYLTREMEEKIDKIIEEKLQGSGLKF